MGRTLSTGPDRGASGGLAGALRQDETLNSQFPQPADAPLIAAKSVFEEAGPPLSVEVHLRALPGLEDQDVEALVAMVKAGYNHAKKVRSTK